MAEAVRHIVCPHCEAINRIPAGKTATPAKCGRCHLALFTGQPIAATATSFATHIQRNDIPVVVDFWAEWCGPCKAMAPTYQRIASEFEPELRFLKVDTEAHPDLATRYRIKGIPTLILFRNGAPIAQQVGAADAQTLRSWLWKNAGVGSA